MVPSWENNVFSFVHLYEFYFPYSNDILFQVWLKSSTQLFWTDQFCKSWQYIFTFWFLPQHLKMAESLNIVQLSTGWRRLRAADPSPGQTKLLLSSKRVYNYFIKHFHFYQNFRIHSFHSHIQLVFSVSSSVKSESLDHVPRHSDVDITWIFEPMKIRPSVNSSIADNIDR